MDIKSLHNALKMPVGTKHTQASEDEVEIYLSAQTDQRKEKPIFLVTNKILKFKNVLIYADLCFYPI